MGVRQRAAELDTSSPVGGIVATPPASIPAAASTNWFTSAGSASDVANPHDQPHVTGLQIFAMTWAPAMNSTPVATRKCGATRNHQNLWDFGPPIPTIFAPSAVYWLPIR